MADRVLDTYDDWVATGVLEANAAQRVVAEQLAQLGSRLSQVPAHRPSGVVGNILSRLRTVAPPPRGLYIHGPVGRGKTMLMGMFYEHVACQPRRRVHFHEFMSDVHDRIGQARERVPGDPIPVVAAEIASSARLLCFDEFHVTDIADAMILGRLFATLFADGVVVVATSNAEPADLYPNGLNRQLFVPFIDLLRRHMDVVALEADKDFRLEKLAGAQLYFSPNDEKARSSLNGHWARLTGGKNGNSVLLEVKGRNIRVPQSAMGVARFDFESLCGQPLGANDYLHIAHAYHTLIVDDIPQLTRERRDAARRFITLIDTIYDNRVCLICSAAAEPDDLYPEGHGADLFERTASRLMEMRSAAYVADREGRGVPVTAD